MPIQITSATQIPPASCAPWCAYPDDPAGYCMSEVYEVPAALPESEPVTASLFAEDGLTTVNLSAGDGWFLPAISLDAAEELARHLCELVALARK